MLREYVLALKCVIIGFRWRPQVTHMRRYAKARCFTMTWMIPGSSSRFKFRFGANGITPSLAFCIFLSLRGPGMGAPRLEAGERQRPGQVRKSPSSSALRPYAGRGNLENALYG